MLPPNLDELDAYKNYSPLEDTHIGPVKDPYSSLVFYEMTHEWGPGRAPSYPGDPETIFDMNVKHAQFGVQAFKVRTNFHTGTHMCAPVHLFAFGDDLEHLPTDHFFGNGCILDLRNKKNWDKITAEDLKAAGEIREGDFVCINTGWHHKYSDSLEYFGEAPGLTEDAAEYLISKKVKLVAVDTPYVDCPVATNLTVHAGRPGPFMKRLVPTYIEKHPGGEDPYKVYPGFYPAGKALAKAGIPVIQQVAGDVDDITGKRVTMIATPWKTRRGSACPVRFTAIIDTTGEARIDKGEAF